MADFATALALAEIHAASRKRAADRRMAYDAPRGLAPASVSIGSVEEDRTVHCFDPWIIVRSEPNREHAAHCSLRREGFECWYPAGRRLKQLPQRFISSKTRHKKRHVVLEELRLPYPGYLFIRRMTQASQSAIMWRLYELDGVLGVCTFGEHLAIAEDYEIQMLRFKEDLGTFDLWDLSINAKEFGLAEVRRSEAAKERWDKPPKLLGTLDSNRSGSLHLVEAFGRITRVIAASGDLHIPR
jgi:hypothetical protein